MTEEAVSPATLEKLYQAITECSSLKVKFGFLKLGSLCDASKSRAFTSATCDIEVISKIINTRERHYSVDFNLLFKRGFKLFEGYREKNSFERCYQKYAPINTLAEFWGKIGKSFTDMLYKNYETDLQQWNMFCLC